MVEARQCESCKVTLRSNERIGTTMGDGFFCSDPHCPIMHTDDSGPEGDPVYNESWLLTAREVRRLFVYISHVQLDDGDVVAIEQEIGPQETKTRAQADGEAEWLL